MSHATVITSATNKGGGGKTTLQLVLAAEAARAGANVLLVDLDRNRSLSSLLGAHTEVTQGTGYRLVKDQPLDRDVRTLRFGDVTLDLAPMGVGFRNHYFERALDNEVELSGVDRRDPDAVERVRFGRLHEHLETLRDRYDYIFLDVQNDDGDLAMNALYASDHVLTPMTPDPMDVELAMTGLRHVWHVHRDHRADLHLAGCALNRVDRAFLGRQTGKARDTLHPRLASFLLDTTLRRAPGVLQAAYGEHMPPNLTSRARQSGARDGTSFATDCETLWQELAKRLCDQRANPDAWRDPFRAFAEDAERAGWQNLVNTGQAKRGNPPTRLSASSGVLHG